MSVGLVIVTLLTLIAVEKRWLGLFEDVFFISFHIIFRFLIFFFFLLLLLFFFLKKSGKIKLLLFLNSVDKGFLFCLYLIRVSFLKRVFQFNIF